VPGRGLRAELLKEVDDLQRHPEKAETRLAFEGLVFRTAYRV
jgi:hypothetical protein